jgi:hypothetical protein
MTPDQTIDKQAETSEMWGIVDLFGHTKIAGKISEQTLGGAAFVRVDVPYVPGVEAHTRLFGNSAIYSISFTSQAIAESVARKIQSKPISVYDLDQESRTRLAALPAPKIDRNPYGGGREVMIDPNDPELRDEDVLFDDDDDDSIE